MANSSGIDQDLLRRLQSFDLTDEEGDLAHLNANDISIEVEECRNSCFGKLYALRETPLKFIRPAMIKAWKSEYLKVIRIKENLYQIFFRTADEMNSIIKQGPWCID